MNNLGDHRKLVQGDGRLYLFDAEESTRRKKKLETLRGYGNKIVEVLLRYQDTAWYAGSPDYCDNVLTEGFAYIRRHRAEQLEKQLGAIQLGEGTRKRLIESTLAEIPQALAEELDLVLLDINNLIHDLGVGKVLSYQKKGDKVEAVISKDAPAKIQHLMEQDVPADFDTDKFRQALRTLWEQADKFNLRLTAEIRPWYDGKVMNFPSPLEDILRIKDEEGRAAAITDEQLYKRFWS